MRGSATTAARRSSWHGFCFRGCWFVPPSLPHTHNGRAVSSSWSSSSCFLTHRRGCATTTTTTTVPIPEEDGRIAADLADGIQSHSRRSISRAVTYAESSLPRHAVIISEVLRRLRAARSTTQEQRPHQRRIAISGSPGAGKSCFIDALGTHLTETLGLTVGVLAVDPSSSVSGGSILGDKTRMEALSHHPNAFVRPSPSRGHLGGVTARCWETLEVFEAAQFDVTLVETVGVGQSETEAAHLTDLFVLLVPPASGDELQGVKKGIVEMADAVLVTKCDGDRRTLAEMARAHYKRAVMLTRSTTGSPRRRRRAAVAPSPAAALHPEGEEKVDCMKLLAEEERRSKPVLCVSSESGMNIPEAWKTIDDLWQRQRETGELAAHRMDQREEHFQAYLEHELVHRARAFLQRQPSGSELRRQVACGTLSPRAAGDLALQQLLRSPPTD